jgi:hypothetical protein
MSKPTQSREALIPFILTKPGHALGWRKVDRVGSNTKDWYAECVCGDSSIFTTKRDLDEWAYWHWKEQPS